MSKYEFRSERKALKMEIQEYLVRYSDDLVEFYLSNGFDALAISLKMKDDWRRRILFDFLVLEKKSINECIRRNKAFFLKIISDGNGEMIRTMLGLLGEKYDQAWLEALDLLNLYFVQRKVDDKLFNLSLEKFFENSILNERNKEE
jgi:hypothetical protein